MEQDIHPSDVEITADHLETEWYSNLKGSFEESEEKGKELLSTLCNSMIRSPETSAVALLQAVDKLLRDLINDTAIQQFREGFWLVKCLPIIVDELDKLYTTLTNHKNFKTCAKETTDLSTFVSIVMKEDHSSIQEKLYPPTKAAYQEIIKNLLVLVKSHARTFAAYGAIQSLAENFDDYPAAKDLVREIIRRRLIIAEMLKYFERIIENVLIKRRMHVIEHHGNAEKYLAFHEDNSDFIVIPYVSHYPTVFYDRYLQLFEDLGKFPLNEAKMTRLNNRLFDMFMPMIRYEPSLVHMFPFRPKLSQVDELRKKKDEECWKYMKDTNRKNWAQYFKLRQNYFCFLLEYHTDKLEKRVILRLPEDDPLDLESRRVVVFLDDLNNPDAQTVRLISSTYPKPQPKELPREQLLTWTEDYTADYIKEVLINDHKILNNLLGLITYSNKYLQIFLEVITHEPGTNKEPNQEILHSGCSFSLLILTRKYLPEAFDECDFFKTSQKINKFFRAMAFGINSLLSYGVLKVYIDKFRDQFGNRWHLLDNKNWKDGIGKLEKTLEERLKAEWLFSEYFEDENVDKYYKDETLKGVFVNTIKKFYNVLYFIFIEKTSYLFANKNMHPMANQTIYRMKELLHRFALLRRKFYNEDFRKIVQNLFFGDRNIECALMGSLSQPFPYTSLVSLLTKTWPELHAQELIGKTTLGQYGADSIEVIQTLSSTEQSCVQLVTVTNYVSKAVAKRYLDEKCYFNVAEVLEVLMRMQSHPHILHLYGYLVEDEDYVGILMEYCSGGTLMAAIEAGQLYNEDHIISWSGQAASGLLYLHRNDILHRNLTPAKMFLNSAKTVLKIGGTNGQIPSGSDFLAPEVEGHGHSKESDIFSLGKCIEYVVHRRNQQTAVITEELRSLYESMTAVDAKERPKLDAILQDLKLMRK